MPLREHSPEVGLEDFSLLDFPQTQVSVLTHSDMVPKVSFLLVPGTLVA